MTSELRERIEDARRVAGAASKRVGADGKVRCGCENLRCRSCRGDGCRSRVEAASVALNKGKREQRATGKALMRAAKEMER